MQPASRRSTVRCGAMHPDATCCAIRCKPAPPPNHQRVFLSLVFNGALGLLLMGAGPRALGAQGPFIPMRLLLGTEGRRSPQETRPQEQGGQQESETDESGEEVPGAGEMTAKKPRSYPLSGSVSLSYRARREQGDLNDEDAYGYVYLDGGDASVDDVTFHLSARATWDLDSDPGVSTNPFFSLNDIHGDDLDHHVYEAWVALHNELAPDSLGLDSIRLGRQTVQAAYTYLVDGASVAFERVPSLGDLRLRVFGGVPQYLYESSRSGDWLAGADASLLLAQKTRLQLRYVHVNGENRWNLGSEENDDYAGVTVRHALGDNLLLTGEWNTIDAETRDASLSASWSLPEHDLTLRGTYLFQDDIEEEFTTPFDPFIGVLKTSFAYHQVDALASKLFGEHFGTDLGVTVRELQDDSDDGAFNREYVRAWTTLSTYDWPLDGVDLALTGEVWDAGADDTAALGASATLRPREDIRLTAGVDYALYKYDLFVVEERQDATTLFLKARWKAEEHLRFDGRYEYETGDTGSFHSLWLGLTWSF